MDFAMLSHVALHLSVEDDCACAMRFLRSNPDSLCRAPTRVSAPNRKAVPSMIVAVTDGVYRQAQIQVHCYIHVRPSQRLPNSLKGVPGLCIVAYGDFRCEIGRQPPCDDIVLEMAALAYRSSAARHTWDWKILFISTY
jgi:hypothetical protein